MSYYSYVFVGYVHPIAANVTLASQDFTIRVPSEDEGIQGKLDITDSAITMTVIRTKSIHDLRTAKDRLQRFALIKTAAYAFVHEVGLDIEITDITKIRASHPPFVFGKANMETPRDSKNDEEIKRYWNLTEDSTSWPLREGLINYMRALRDPEEAMMFCYRAIETIGHDPNFYKSGTDINWHKLRGALNIAKSYFDPLTSRAAVHRHGGQMIPSREEYIAALKTAHSVIERYAAYLENRNKNLSLEEFPTLIESEFSIHLPKISAPWPNAAISSTSCNSVTIIDVPKPHNSD